MTSQPHVFCDWISIYQVHADAPVVNSGRVFSVDQDGEVLWDVASKVLHRGSFETTVRISSDGNRVSLDGNVGRFNRSDNVFGYGVLDCVKIANLILADFGLPLFTDVGLDAPSRTMMRSNEPGTGVAFLRSGAMLTRLDLTRNYASGSQSNATQVIRAMQGYKSGRHEPRPYYTSGVSWGEGSKYAYAKLYDKAADYIRHRSPAHSLHDPLLYDFILKAGVVRHEISLKSRYLTQKNLTRFMLWDAEMSEKVYALFTDPLSAAAHVDEFLEIDGRAGELAVAWRDGADLKKRLSKNTYYRYRRQLLMYGIDIAVPANVSRLKTRVEVIQLTPLEVPAFYQLPRIA